MKLSSHRVTFFSRTSKGQLQTWSCWIEADGITVTSTWGIKGGKMQLTQDKMFSRGRKGTAAYKSPQAVALEEHARQVKKKIRAGYVEQAIRTQAVQLEKLKTDFDFDHMPRSFAPAKPVREIDSVEASRLDVAGKLAKQRKRDGMRHYLVAGSDSRVRVYSRGMDDLTAHFERLLVGLSLPPGTILDAEFVVSSPDGDDDFKAVSEICRSKPERARRTMASYEKTGNVPQFMVFDLLFYDRLPTWQLPFENRRNALLIALDKAYEKKGRRNAIERGYYYVVPMQQYEISLDQCMALVKRKGWEGLVLWRKDQPTQVHMNGKPKRCNCYKFKPMREEDFIATGFELGQGRNSKVVGALKLAYYIDGKEKQFDRLIPIGNVGTGLDEATRKAALRWKYPCVVQVKFEKMSKTGLRFPAFLRVHPDKKPRECVL